MPKLKFIIVGTAKAGTTSIYHQLRNRYFIPKKETFYYVREAIQTGTYEYPLQRPAHSIIKAENDYVELYNNPTHPPAEVSTCYLYYYKTVIPQLLTDYGDGLKILICLRNPIDRTKSNYLHFRREGFENLELENAIAKSKERLAEGYDFMWDYVGLSQYYEAIKAYQANFKAVKVVFFEDLKQQPQAFYTDVLSFIEEQPTLFASEKIEHQNKSGIMKNAWLFKTMKQAYNKMPLVKKIAQQALGEERLREVRRGVKEQFYAEDSAAQFPIDRVLLKKIFEKEIIQLSELLDQDLSQKWPDFQTQTIPQ